MVQALVVVAIILFTFSLISFGQGVGQSSPALEQGADVIEA
jgi:hypothetical protein